MFLNYTCKLGFEDKPNYAYVRNLFHNIRIHEGYQDNVFDWCLLRTGLDGQTPGSDMKSNQAVSKENDKADPKYSS